MPEVTIRHEFDCDEKTYWEHCVFNHEFNKRLYFDTLKFPGYTLLSSEDDDAKTTRKLKIDPPVAGLPGPVKKAIGDRFSYVEEGAYDKKAGRYRCTITPSTMPDKTTVWAEMWLEKLGEKRVARLVKVHVEVKVFMIGSLVEEKIMGDLKHSYDAAAKFTHEYLREKGL